MSLSKKRLNELENISDQDIDFSDIPELDKNFWDKTEVRLPKNKKAISLRLDPDTLDWFQEQGKGYQKLMNAVLNSYYRVHKNTEKINEEKQHKRKSQ